MLDDVGDKLNLRLLAMSSKVFSGALGSPLRRARTLVLEWTETALLVLSPILLLTILGLPLEILDDPFGGLHALIATGILFPLMFCIWLLSAAVRMEIKRRRDSDAQRVFAAMLQGSHIPFVLILRRFQGDTELVMQPSPLASPFRWLNHSTGQMVADQLENLVVRAFRREMPAIKIAPPGSGLDLGAGVVSFAIGDPAWRDAFERLAKAAHAIVVVPLTDNQSALLEEVRWLHANGLSDKILFLMPPDMTVRWSTAAAPERTRTSVASLWERSAQALADGVFGTFPGHAPGGGVITLRKDRPNFSATIGSRRWSEPAAIRRAVENTTEPETPAHAASRYALLALLADGLLVVSSVVVPEYLLGDMPDAELQSAISLPAAVFLLGVVIWLWATLRRTGRWFHGWRRAVAVALALALPFATFFLAMTSGRMLYPFGGYPLIYAASPTVIILHFAFSYFYARALHVKPRLLSAERNKSESPVFESMREDSIS